jgi:hypothetical protein
VNKRIDLENKKEELLQLKDIAVAVANQVGYLKATPPQSQ